MKKYLDILSKNKIRGYQKNWLHLCLENDKVFLLGARQIGKSWIVALLACIIAHGYTKTDGTHCYPHDVKIISKDKQSAKNIIAMVNKHLKIAEQVEGKLILNKRRGGVDEAVLLNGTIIKAMPGVPTALQGFTGTVIVDEVSISRFNPEDLLDQALSVSNSKSYMKVILVSNADIQGSFVYNFFYSEEFEWRVRRKEFVLDQVDIYRAYDNQLTDSLVSVKNTMVEKSWKRFYENQFLGAGLGIIAKSEMTRFITSSKPDLKNGIVLMGVDPGFSDKGNPTGCVVALVTRDYVHVIHADLWHGKDINWQISEITRLAQLYRPNKIYIDQGVGGYVLYKELEKKGIGRIEGISATQSLQETSWHILESIISTCKIQIDVNCASIIIDDICSAIWDDKGRLHIPQRPFDDGRKGTIHGDSLLALLYLIKDANSYLGVKNNSAPTTFSVTPPLKGVRLG